MAIDVYVDRVYTPAGPLGFAVDAQGALVWSQFEQGDYGTSLEQELQQAGFAGVPDAARTADARRQLEEYARGTRIEFTIPLALKGTKWQATVWQALTHIPYGETRSYGEIAALIGHHGAARAVGRANATNHVPLVVPCHRVVGADGTLTGYAGGLHLKERLLAHERRVLAATKGQDFARAHGQV